MTESSKDMERGQVEALEDLDSRYQAMPEPRADVSGTVKLFSDSDASVVLIPTPSPDPKGKCNPLPLSVYSSMCTGGGGY